MSFLSGMSCLADLGRAKKLLKTRRQRLVRKATAECPFPINYAATPVVCPPGCDVYTKGCPSDAIICCKPAGGTGGQPGEGVDLPVVPGKKRESPLQPIEDALLEIDKQRQRLSREYGDPKNVQAISSRLRELVLDIYDISMRLPPKLGDKIRMAASGFGGAEGWEAYAGLVAEAGWPIHDLTAFGNKTAFIADVVKGLNDAKAQGQSATDDYLVKQASAASAAIYQYAWTLAKTLETKKLAVPVTELPVGAGGGYVMDFPWNKGEPIRKFKAYPEEIAVTPGLATATAFVNSLINLKPVRPSRKKDSIEKERPKFGFWSVGGIQDWAFASVTQNPSAQTLAAAAAAGGTAASRMTGLGQPAIQPEKPRKRTTAELVAIGAAAGATVGVATGSKTAGVIAGMVCPMILILIEQNAWEEYDAFYNRAYAQAGKPTGATA